MVALQVEQTLVGRLTHPEMEGHGTASKEIVHASHHFYLHVLHHVGRVQARPQPGVEVIIDELAQVRATARQQLVQRLPVSLADLVDQGAASAQNPVSRWA